MKDKTKDTILDVAKQLTSNYEKQEVASAAMKTKLPDVEVVYSMIDDLRKLTFPGHFGTEKYLSKEAFAEGVLLSLYEKMKSQMKVILSDKQKAEELTTRFMEAIPRVQELLAKDVEAQLAGDPAANSTSEVILAYPGLFTIFVYRYAHVLYELEVPMLPRIMSEYAHGKTGIDINPGATIGEYFFIDHGTGVVIGETAIIGNGVKIYQGVTIGALSTRKGQALSGVKRHPTIEDNVIIYANATILGGNTVVGEGATVAGNTFVTESVPAGAKVSAMHPELNVRTCENCTRK
ncbi:MAG: serine O-acetyltransferase EpsC [Faecalimonas sp.]|nr:serine acetyltransferase [Tyzzerella sp.]MEE0884444.1 serine O-acetyltransferase EpsC [Faecalimonas sp.]